MPPRTPKEWEALSLGELITAAHDEQEQPTDTLVTWELTRRQIISAHRWSIVLSLLSLAIVGLTAVLVWRTLRT